MLVSTKAATGVYSERKQRRLAEQTYRSALFCIDGDTTGTTMSLLEPCLDELDGIYLAMQLVWCCTGNYCRL